MDNAHCLPRAEHLPESSRNGRSISDGLTPAIKKSPSFPRGFILFPYPLQRRRSRQEFPCSPFEDFIYSGNQPLIPFDPPVSFILEVEQHVSESFRVFRGPGPLHPFPKLRGGYGFSIFTESLLEVGTREPFDLRLICCPARLQKIHVRREQRRHLHATGCIDYTPGGLRISRAFTLTTAALESGARLREFWVRG